MEAPRTIDVYVAELSPKTAARILVTVAAFTVPAGIYLGQEFAFLPLAAILFCMLFDMGYLVYMGLHAAVYGPLLVGGARVAAKFICARENAGTRAALFLALIAGMLALTFLPVYGLRGEVDLRFQTGPEIVSAYFHVRATRKRNERLREEHRKNPPKPAPSPERGWMRKGQIS